MSATFGAYGIRQSLLMRFAGMNIARALGDKFLKEEDGCFSSQPFVSEPLRIEPESKVLALIARSVCSNIVFTNETLLGTQLVLICSVCQISSSMAEN
jgi:hypothetical protein